MEVLMKEDLNDLLKASWSRIEDMIAKGKKLLEAVIKNFPHIENISYNDALKEIGDSFKKVLNSYCQNYKGLLINILEPVLASVIALDIF